MLSTIRFSSPAWRILGELCGKPFNRKGRKGTRKVRNGLLSLLPLLLLPLLFTCTAFPQASEKVIIDTDIGDDIDDAFAVALALRSPELQILGISTTFGDTQTRAKLVDRMLGEAGRTEIPVAVGVHTDAKTAFGQRPYAEGGHFARPSHPQSVDFILEQIRRNPGEITLVCIGPLVNVGAMIDRDPQTFRKLKRVVMMGGSIDRGYGDPYSPPTPAEPEWNIKNDSRSAQKLFASGVPIYDMPLDSTQLKLEEVGRAFLFRQGTPLTDALAILYHQWGQETPTLYDPMTIAFIDDAKLCPVEPMHIDVDSTGMTRRGSGSPNAQVCLHSDPQAFIRFYLSRVAAQ
ncbi:MAG TPA: nucleoside hydrolase [Terriglobales bacterium]